MVLCLLTLWLAACEPSARLQPLPEDAAILAFGDSLTRGTGAAPGEDYPAVLERLVGLRVVNAGVPGEETDAALRRLPGELERHRPALVILVHGGNDFLRKRDPARIEAHLRAMIQAAHRHGAQVLLVAVPRPGLLIADHPVYARLASELGVPLLEGALAEILSQGGLKADPVHPNARGYARLAEALAARLRALGAL
jgi:lysophospholipase L1-like esterase